MRIPACIFTHAGAALWLPWTVRGALLAGFIPVVCQDAFSPLPPQTLGWLEAQGVEIRTTRFTRRGNLNGTDCAAGICREMAEACVRHGSTHCLKLDDDTAVIWPSTFTKRLQFDAVGLTHADGRPGAYGLAYCLHRDVAAHVAARLEALPIDPSVPEDLTIWNMARQAGSWCELPFRHEGGPWSALPPGYDVEDAVRRFSVLTVGNAPEGGWTDRPRQMERAMRGLVEAAGMLQGECSGLAGAV
jgi:hypothetical protein